MGFTKLMLTLVLAFVAVISVRAGASAPQFCLDCCDAARGSLLYTLLFRT